MSRPGFLASPFFLGFDEMERLLERATRTAPEAYPPLNIEEPAENILRITLAVAGFAPEQLSLTICDRELTVRGERPPPADERVYLHKGIAARGFVRTFVLAQCLEVERAVLGNGLLRIDLRRMPQNHQVRQIPITSD
jgi:HSP20 family molecular chaperone IbpA